MALFILVHIHFFSCRSADPHPMESIQMGGVARAFASVLLLPFTVIKIRYEVSSVFLNGHLLFKSVIFDHFHQSYFVIVKLNTTKVYCSM